MNKKKNNIHSKKYFLLLFHTIRIHKRYVRMIPKSRFVDTNGNPMTQSLFLEQNYDTKYAVYTLKDDDHMYKGTLYPSLKKIYLEEEDPTEYLFAIKNLLGWTHWQRICNNKVLSVYVNQWRDELEIKLRAIGVRSLRDMASSEGGNFQAAKFLADRGWDKNRVGRPSKLELEKRAAIGKRVDDEFKADIKRLEDYRRA